ncbi:MAG TPA: ABC transporter permease, partial [Candidatus Omnitrophica bacterium]|nr:ABC transporter permease [Candidatus Omnitrophota bacterium]
YIIRRFLVAIPLILAISFLTFALINLTPGNFFDQMRLNPQVSEDTINRYMELYRLDRPLIVQYFAWLKRLLYFDFGYSFAYNIPVRKVLGMRVFNTLILTISSFFFTWIVALPLGIIAAVNSDKILDRIISFFSYLLLAVPTFFLAFLFLYFAFILRALPLGGMVSANFTELGFWAKVFDLLKHLIIPTLVISLGAIASLVRIMRANILEVLRTNYILALRARGLSENRVVYVHALRSAINPLITIFGYQISGLLSGAALTEIICNWPGLGSLMLSAVRSQDIYLVMGSMLISSFMLIAGNLVADILLAFADPRIRIS